MNPSLLAVDWGTSSLRGALLDANGQVLDERSFPRGILTVPPGGFPTVFDECFGDWMHSQDLLCLMSGMVGSKQGWQEAAYCPCPAGFEAIASQLCWIEPGRLAIVPGLSCLHPAPAGNTLINALPDVMRGEEAQILGAMRLLGLHDATMVLPGTHSKWARVQGEQITSFATFMTGEFFALLRQHSILARTLPAQPHHADEAAFELGVQAALEGPGLLHTAFSTRTLALFQALKPDQLLEYLSGLVIGEELRLQHPASELPVVLIGADALTLRYQKALALRGISAQRIGSSATWAGLSAIASAIDSDGPNP